MRQQEKAEPMTDIRQRIHKVAWHTPNHDVEEIAEAGAREMAILIRERIMVWHEDSREEGHVKRNEYALERLSAYENIQEEVDDLVALLTVGGRAEVESQEDGAGLIGQTIPDVDGTEPRPICPECDGLGAVDQLPDDPLSALTCERCKGSGRA